MQVLGSTSKSYPSPCCTVPPAWRPSLSSSRDLALCCAPPHTCPTPAVHCSLFTVHCTLLTVHCSPYTVHCSPCTVHCTLYCTFPVLRMSCGAQAALGPLGLHALTAWRISSHSTRTTTCRSSRVASAAGGTLCTEASTSRRLRLLRYDRQYSTVQYSIGQYSTGQFSTWGTLCMEASTSRRLRLLRYDRNAKHRAPVQDFMVQVYCTLHSCSRTYTLYCIEYPLYLSCIDCT